MTNTLSAIVAAGVVYDKADFADPKLEGPTAITVTADGRVYGHLATWGQSHIGMGRRVTPPKSPSGYEYFHQGVVATRDGDLPVGKLTLGTGHAPVARGVDAMAAAAHYDNTGTVVASVRAGEDEHGIWLAGRLVPGVSDERVDELRRSGVSGDWRGVNGHHELVAALAVNVPGFPIPRTEELVASGTMALVAAGIVVPAGADLPQNVDEFNAVLAAAVDARVDAVVADKLAERDRLEAARNRRDAAADRVRHIVASARREQLAGIVAAAVGGETPRPDGMVALLPSEKDAARLAVDGGETVEDLHLTVGYFDDADTMPDDDTIVAALTEALPVVDGAVEGTVNGRAVFNPDKDPASVYLVQADGLTAANQAVAPEGGKYDAYLPHITAAYAPDTPLTEGGPVRFDRVRISRGGEHTDLPLGQGMTAAGRRIRSAEGANRFGLSIGDLIPDAGTIGQAVGNDVGRAAEGVAKALGAKDAPAKVDTPKDAPKPDDTDSDKPSDSGAEPDKPQAESNVSEIPKSTPAPKNEEPEAEFTAEDGLDPDVDDFGEDESASAPIDTAVPPRTDGEPGDRLEEDQAPSLGADGGELVDFADGVATYADGTQTDGTTWTRTEPAKDEEPVTASLWDRTVGALTAANKYHAADGRFTTKGGSKITSVPSTTKKSSGSGGGSKSSSSGGGGGSSSGSGSVDKAADKSGEGAVKKSKTDEAQSSRPTTGPNNGAAEAWEEMESNFGPGNGAAEAWERMEARNRAKKGTGGSNSSGPQKQQAPFETPKKGTGGRQKGGADEKESARPTTGPNNGAAEAWERMDTSARDRAQAELDRRRSAASKRNDTGTSAKTPRTTEEIRKRGEQRRERMVNDRIAKNRPNKKVTPPRDLNRQGKKVTPPRSSVPRPGVWDA